MALALNKLFNNITLEQLTIEIQKRNHGIRPDWISYHSHTDKYIRLEVTYHYIYYEYSDKFGDLCDEEKSEYIPLFNAGNKLPSLIVQYNFDSGTFQINHSYKWFKARFEEYFYDQQRDLIEEKIADLQYQIDKLKKQYNKISIESCEEIEESSFDEDYEKYMEYYQQEWDLTNK